MDQKCYSATKEYTVWDWANWGLRKRRKKDEDTVGNEKVLSYLSTHLKQSQQQEQVSVVPSAQERSQEACLEKPPNYCTLCHTDLAADHSPDLKADLLCKAVRYGCKSCTRTLLEKGSDPLRPCSGIFQETALQIATQNFVDVRAVYKMVLEALPLDD